MLLEMRARFVEKNTMRFWHSYVIAASIFPNTTAPNMSIRSALTSDSLGRSLDDRLDESL